MSPKNLAILWNTLRWVLVATALTPLLYVSGIYYPFIVPKVVYFRTLVEFSVAFLAVYAIYRIDGIDLSFFKNKIAWFLDKADPRVKGTIGNPAFLASYLAITAFFVFDLARKSRSVFVRYFWWFALFIHAFAIIWSQTRGIFVAIFAAAATLFAVWAVTTRERTKRMW